MNSFTLILLCLVSSMSAFIVENETKQPNLMDIIEAILNDPEFVSLKPQEQLRILIAIYNLLETYQRRNQYGERYDSHKIDQQQ
jgi:hypothetical protein